MSSVTLVSYFVVVNEVVSTKFLPTHGLHQGNPLSPYLLIICREGLFALLHLACLNGHILGTQMVRGAPWITYLLFADDNLIFEEATSVGASILMNVLQLYASNSGQLINFEKSSVFFSANLDVVIERYLRLPCIMGRNKKRAFANLRDKFRSRLLSWSICLLSVGGKEVL
ncbi:reverse transcriptase [Gossypium australe]|uniref:Reverse transcriptase n=1 Tax=Gossypium australe TaxID=47621 RepID=A0A5B6X1J5_9ROSI|nr:reverse transcriptase [Gossypium australe]